MRIGDLVRDIDDHTMIGIVLARQGLIDVEVRWLTGWWHGEVTSRWASNLEILNERTK